MVWRRFLMNSGRTMKDLNQGACRLLSEGIHRPERISLLSALALLIAANCVCIAKNPDYKRAGEYCVVSNNLTGVSNAIVHWGKTLTNGYSLLTDAESRHSYIGMLLINDPCLLFMLMEKKDRTSPWGVSACTKRPFFATIIIRIQASESGTRIATAVHEFHVTNRVGFNVHTGLQRGGTAALPPCSKDERAIIG